VSFDDVYDKVLKRRCRSCHLIGDAEANLVMSDIKRAYSNLVEGDEKALSCHSTQNCNDSSDPKRAVKRVVKSNPACSTLYLSIARDPLAGTCTQLMPLGGLPLNAYEVALVRRWIEGNAPTPTQ
jgi:hypothetical protein